MSLPWKERIPMLGVNPEAATIADIKRLVYEYMEARHGLYKISQMRYKTGGGETEEAEMARKTLVKIDEV